MAGILGSVFSGLLGGLFGGGGGGGGSGSNPLMSLLASGLTSQPIPGQTQPGSYTPEQGGFGTYNYIPTGAGQIDPQLLQLIMGQMNTNQGSGNFFNPNSAGPSWNQDITMNALNNPMTGAMTTSAQNAGNLSGQNAAGFEKGAIATGQGGLDILSNLSNLMPQIGSNPFSSAMVQGAGTGGSMLQQAGANAFGQGGAFSGQAPNAVGASNAVLNTAFDPQNALYDKTRLNVTDQMGSYLANSGLTSSGEGAKIAGDTLNNFNIDWQNNQLGRQLSGLQSYTGGMAGAGNTLNTGANLQTQGAGNFAGGAAMPYLAQNQTVTDQLGQLSSAGGVGAAGGNILGQAGNLGNAAVSGTANAGALPYNAFNTGTNNQFGALSNYTAGQSGNSNLNNQNIQQMLSYLTQVMQGSSNASSAAQRSQGSTVNSNASASAGLAGGMGQLGSIIQSILGGGSSGGYGGYGSGAGIEYG